jgi:transposase-like protein
MGEFPRKADGRRVFSAEFKRETIQVIRHWKRRFETGAATAVRVDEDVVPASALREAQARIRELERALGRKTMENEILRAAVEVVRKGPSLRKGSGR